MKAIDAYLGSKELKKTIINRSVELGVPLKLICLDLGIDYRFFKMAYLGSHENKKFEIEEEKFVALLNHLGIKVRFQFVIDKEFDSEEKKEYLREVYNKYGNNR
jgi:hypothetical protein